MQKSIRAAASSLSALAAVASLSGAALAAPTLDHLQCFKVKDASAKAAYTADLSPGNPAFPSIAPGCTIKVPAKLLCIDVAKSNVAPTPPGSAEGQPGQEYLCYKTTCPKSPLTIDARDQFGTHALSVTTTGYACAPIDVRAGASDHTFVVSAIDLPTNGSEALAFGFDLDGVPGDGVDNQLGSILASFGALAPSLDVEHSLALSIDTGETVMLANVRSTGLTDSDPAVLTFYAGTDDITPPPCTDSSDTICRRHLTGDATFTVDASLSYDPDVPGRLISGGFSGGPAVVTLRIVIASTPIVLPLELAQVELAGLSNDGWSPTGSKIGGAIKQTDLETTVIPALANATRTTFAEDCMVGGTPPSCGCTSGSTGATLKNLFDKAPTQDCTISDVEVKTVLDGFVTPDIDLDLDGTPDAISIGVGATAVKGTFTVPH